MSKKILVLTGSARKDGNSNRMAHAFAEAAEAKGHAVKVIDTAKLKLNFCHACETCYKTGKPCSFDDDFNLIADDILAADALVFSSPVYWYSVPSQLKAVIDYCDKRFDEIDAIIVAYGSAGLGPMDELFEVLHRKINECRKPIITICPSLFTEAGNLEKFLAKGHVNLLDEELAVRCVVRVADAVSGSSGQECLG